MATADGPPRLFSEVLADRALEDPAAGQRKAALEQIAHLEAEAKEELADGNQAEGWRLQCEAEAIRACLVDAHVHVDRRA